MLVVPNVQSWPAFLKEEQIRANACVWPKHTIGQANDRMEVALAHEVFLEASFHSLTKQRAIRQHHRGTPTWLEYMNDQQEKQIGCFSSSVRRRKVLLDAVLLHATKRRVRQ